MPVVNLWLYPNHLAKRAPALNDVSFHWLYPGGFSPAGIEVSNTHVDGVPVTATLVDVAWVGERVMAQLPLATPLPPGRAVTVELDFDTRLPRRYGAFGCDGPRCRLMGGFYPMPARDAGPYTSRPDQSPVARAGRTRVTLRYPEGLALVLGGQPIARAGAAPVTVESADALVPTIVTDRVLRPATASVARHVVTYLHRRPRPPSSEDKPLPYVREDIPGLVLDTARRVLLFADAVLGSASHASSGSPIMLVEAPLRHELVQAHGDVVLVSDQIFGIFPAERLRKFHRLELARAMFTVIADAAIRSHEQSGDRERAAGVLAAYLTEAYAVSQFDKLEHAADILRPFDFVPAVDQLLYAPLLASSQSYFGNVDDGDRVKDGARHFTEVSQGSPRLVYNKLLDLLGPSGFATLTRRMLREAVPLRRAAAEVFGADLDWFWSQWLTGWTRVNYRLESVKVTPRTRGSHVVVSVRRELQTMPESIREPVEVLIEDRDGGKQTLRWDDQTDAHTFEIELPAGLKAVEVDPRRRLVESAVGSLRASDDARYDNRRPARWRFVYQGFGALLNVSRLTASFGAGVLIKPQHDLRHQILATAYHTETTQVGAGATYGWNFGPQADKNNLTSRVLAGLSAARIDPSFGLLLGQSPQPGWRASGRVGLSHDTRDYLFDPWRAVGLAAGVSYTLTALESGDRLSQLGAGVEALRLIELGPGHVLALAAEASATFGDIRLRSQLAAAGGPASVRGYFADELLSRANVIGRVQLRNDYVTGLAINLLHFTTVRGFAGTLFADAAAITTCDGYAFSRDRVYADVGYSFRVLHDAFGVYQQLLSIDFAVPVNRHDPYATCQGQPITPVSRPPFTVLVSFFPSF